MWGRAFRYLFYSNVFATCNLVIFSRANALGVIVCAEACFSPLIYFCQILQLWVCVLSSPTCEQRPCLSGEVCLGLNTPPPMRFAVAAQRFQKCFWWWNISWSHSILTMPEFCKVCLCEFGAERLRERRAFTRCRWRSTKLYNLEVEDDFRICVLIIISNPTILPFDDKLQHQYENWWINKHTMKTT